MGAAEQHPRRPLHRLLFGDARPTAQSRQRARCSDDGCAAAARRARGRARRAIAVERRRPPTRPPVQRRRARRAAALAVRAFDRVLDLAWARTSYSALTPGRARAVGAAVCEPEAEEPGTEDEPEVDAPNAGARATPAAPSTVPSPMADAARSGRRSAPWCTRVLEHTDFAAADLRGRAASSVRRQPGRAAAPASPPATLADALLPSLLTPLGPLAGGLRLRRRRAARPAATSWTSSCRWPAATRADRRGVASARSRRCCDGTCPPATRCAATPTTSRRRRWRRSRCAATSPAASTWCCGCATDAGRRATWSSTTRPTGSAARRAADRRWHYRPEAMAAAMRDGALPAAGAAVLGRRCTGSCAGGSPATTRTLHLGGVLYLFLRGMCRTGRRRWSTACRAGCSPGGRRPRW